MKCLNMFKDENLKKEAQRFLTFQFMLIDKGDSGIVKVTECGDYEISFSVLSLTGEMKNQIIEICNVLEVKIVKDSMIDHIIVPAKYYKEFLIDWKKKEMEKDFCDSKN